MLELWKIAIGISGLGAVSALVIWSLYREWLRLPIFQTLTKKQQFTLFMTFLILTFLFGIAGLVTYASVVKQNGTNGTQHDKKSNLTLSAVRFHPKNSNKLDIMVRNTGNTVAVIDTATFRVSNVYLLSPNKIQMGAVHSTETYTVKLTAEETPYKIDVPFHQGIAADTADRFTISLDASKAPDNDEYVFEFIIDFKHDGKVLSSQTILYLASSSATYFPAPHTDTKSLEYFLAWRNNTAIKSPKLVSLIAEFNDG